MRSNSRSGRALQ